MQNSETVEIFESMKNKLGLSSDEELRKFFNVKQSTHSMKKTRKLTIYEKVLMEYIVNH